MHTRLVTEPAISRNGKKDEVTTTAGDKGSMFLYNRWNNAYNKVSLLYRPLHFKEMNLAIAHTTLFNKQSPVRLLPLTFQPVGICDCNAAEGRKQVAILDGNGYTAYYPEGKQQPEVS